MQLWNSNSRIKHWSKWMKTNFTPFTLYKHVPKWTPISSLACIPKGFVFSPLLNNLEIHLCVCRHFSITQKMLQLFLTTFKFNTYLTLLPSGTQMQRPSPWGQQDAVICDLTVPSPCSCADVTAADPAPASLGKCSGELGLCDGHGCCQQFMCSSHSVLHWREEIRSLMARYQMWWFAKLTRNVSV